MKKRSFTLGLLLLFLATLFSPFPAHAQDTNTWSVSSPDGSITSTLSLQNGGLYYLVEKDGACVIENTQLGITLSDIDFANGGLSFLSCTTRQIDETYSLPGGSIKGALRNHANELKLDVLKNSRQLTLYFRSYDDGIAYRYEAAGTGNASITSEKSGFNLPENTSAWASNWIKTYENPPTEKTYSNLSSSFGNFLMPLLAKLPNGTYVALCEADVDKNYCASHLRGGSGALLSVEWAPDQSGAVSAEYPARSPWRAAIIADDLNTLINSTLVDNLSPASEILDTSWIKGGRAAWDWGAGITPSYASAIQLVDFAAEMGWEYVTLDAGWDPTYIPDVVQYAAPKGIGIWLWAHLNDLDTEAEVNSNLPLWASFGIKGMKVDFFESDSQSMMEKYEKITEKAEELHLLLNYHGCTKPTGWERRWPNILSMEGIKGNEYYLWSDGNTAENTCTLPFTRGLAGPADYTPVMYSNNKNQTTWAHQTAFALIMHSNLINFCDHYDVYRSFITKDFLSALPVDYDETKLIEGSVGDYATIARKKGNDWFIGSISNGARIAEIPLDFLGDGQYQAYLYQDGFCDSDIRYSQLEVTSSSTLSIPLRTHGGCAIYLSQSSNTFHSAYDLLDNTGWTADASANTSEASNALNRDTSSRWTTKAAQTSGQWFKVDMLTQKTFNRIKLDTGYGNDGDYPHGFEVYASEDGVNWGNAVATGKGAGRITDILFDNTTARYLKIVQTGSDSAWWGISNLEVYGNNGIAPQTIPGKIEAESYTEMAGVDRETTTDTDGGYNVSHLDKGDWMDYRVSVADPGKYFVEYRVSCNSSQAKQLQLNVGDSVLDTKTIPPTGGWQNWQTVGSVITLGEGFHTLRIYAPSDSWNINWIKFSKLEPGTTYEGENGVLNGNAAVRNSGNFSGGKKVGYLGGGSANSLEFQNVQVNSAGNYTMKVSCAVNGTRSFFVSVNGGSGIEVSCSGNSWDFPVIKDVPISLSQGSNSIRFYNDSGYCPDLDKIDFIR